MKISLIRMCESSMRAELDRFGFAWARWQHLECRKYSTIFNLLLKSKHVVEYNMISHDLPIITFKH